MRSARLPHRLRHPWSNATPCGRVTSPDRPCYDRHRRFLFVRRRCRSRQGVPALVPATASGRSRPLSYATPISDRFYTSSIRHQYRHRPERRHHDQLHVATSCATRSPRTERLVHGPGGCRASTVTSAVIFAARCFSAPTARSIPRPASAAPTWGGARYAVNLLNASGVIVTGSLCGGSRSGVFVGGGIPPSPVVGIFREAT